MVSYNNYTFKLKQTFGKQPCWKLIRKRQDKHLKNLGIRADTSALFEISKMSVVFRSQREFPRPHNYAARSNQTWSSALFWNWHTSETKLRNISGNYTHSNHVLFRSGHSPKQTFSRRQFYPRSLSLVKSRFATAYLMTFTPWHILQFSALRNHKKSKSTFSARTRRLLFEQINCRR